jgi:hypothetical protein
MRLIDADELKSWIDCGHLRPPTELCFSELDVVQILDKRPTIDAVPVVLCDDCYWRSATGYCRRYGHSAPDGFFCADGRTAIFANKSPEKKTEERCMATGLACSRCVPGPCDHRRPEIK